MIEDYNECYIAFLDILGFKNFIKSRGIEEILDVYKKMQSENLRTIYRFGEKLIEDNKVKMKIMSDSICAYIDVDSKNSLLSLVAWCAHFQTKLIEMETPILLRGSIVRGNIYAKGDITFGTGVTKAYLMEEKIAKYPRVIMSKELICDALDSLVGDSRNTFLGLLCEEKDYFYSIDYINFLFALNKNEVVDKLERHAKGIIYSDSIDNMDSRIREKYEYVIESINRCKSLRKMNDQR